MSKSKITSNVLENISSRINNQSFSSKEGNALVVFNGSSLELNNQLEYLKILKKSNLNISIGFSFMSEKILDINKIISILKPVEIFREEDIFKLPLILDKYSILVAPNITMNTLSKVSLGMIDSFVPTIIWSFLYHGKKVYLDFKSVRNYMGVESKSKGISNSIEAHIQTIIKMGALELTENKNIPVTEKVSATTLNNGKDAKGLVTERDILALGKDKGVLVLKKGTLITPLAKDKARELGITIEIN